MPFFSRVLSERERGGSAHNLLSSVKSFFSSDRKVSEASLHLFRSLFHVKPLYFFLSFVLFVAISLLSLFIVFNNRFLILSIIIIIIIIIIVIIIIIIML